MDPELAHLIEDLARECDWLRHKWMEFEELYSRGPERIELLNQVAPNFFYVVHQLFFVDAMLHLCRMTDPPRASNKDQSPNLTILAVAELIPDEFLRETVRIAAEEARKKCEFARPWRSKKLAHSDMNAFRDEARSLPLAEANMVEAAIAAIRDVLTTIEKHYQIWIPTSFARDPWGASALMQHLEKTAHAVDE